MEITTESKYAKIQILNQAFNELAIFFQQKGMPVAWGVGRDAEFLWNTYSKHVENVRAYFMESRTHRIDRHKIIALMVLTILEKQPLVLNSDNVSHTGNYFVNAVYALYFGVQYLTRWNEVYNLSFSSEKFLKHLFTVDKGNAFFREHIKLLCAESPSPIPVFWASHLWCTLEQWGLSHMQYETKFLTVMGK